jgi:hypothetical protein
VWPGFAAAGIAGSAFYYGKKRSREAAVPQFVEVQVGKSQLRPKHSRSALESTIEVRLSNGRSPARAAGVRGGSLTSVIGGGGVGAVIGLPSLHALDRAHAARIGLASGATDMHSMHSESVSSLANSEKGGNRVLSRGLRE